MAGRHRHPDNARAKRPHYQPRRSPRAYVAVAMAATTGVGLATIPASADTVRMVPVAADDTRPLALRDLVRASRAERPDPPAPDLLGDRADFAPVLAARQAEEEAARQAAEALAQAQRSREAELARQEAEKAARAAAEAQAAQAAASASSAAEVAVRVALAQQGKPYVWGATGSASFDCSSLVQYAYAQAGVPLPRVTYAQVLTGVAVTRAALQPGDLVFYNDGPSGPEHVALYIGGGQVVQAPSPGDVVRVTSLDWAGTPTAYRRVA